MQVGGVLGLVSSDHHRHIIHRCRDCQEFGTGEKRPDKEEEEYPSQLVDPHEVSGTSRLISRHARLLQNANGLAHVGDRYSSALK